MSSGGAKPSPRIVLRRLTGVTVYDVRDLLNEPRNWRHMPLAGVFTDEATADWVQGKDAQWDQHGYGPWAILIDGEFAGWGGFQCEGGVADYGLVLAPRFWGLGASVTRLALDYGFKELALDEVTIALPLTRNPDAALGRLGFRADGVVTHGTAEFRRFRLSAADWRAIPD
ncbi:MAG: GNAT family protein [Micropruina sp.]